MLATAAPCAASPAPAPPAVPRYLLDLHPELLLLVLHRLSVRDQAACARTCKRLRTLLYDASFQRLHVARFRARLQLGRAVEPFLLPFVEDVALENPQDATALLSQFARARELRLRRVAFDMSQSPRTTHVDWRTVLEHLVQVPSVRDITFNGCQLQPHDLHAFEQMPFLRAVTFHGALAVNDALIPHLKRTAVHELTVTDARSWMDTGLASLGALQQLQCLRLVGCSAFADHHFAEIAQLRHLRVLSLDGCTQITDNGIAQMGTLPRLEDLSLVKCFYISDMSLSRLARQPQLRRLNLSMCFRITDHGLAHLSTIRSLRELSLRQCSRITSLGMFCLGSNRANLVSLDVSGCSELAEDSVAWLARQLALSEADRMASLEMVPSVLPSLFTLPCHDKPADSSASLSPLEVLWMDSSRVLSDRTLRSVIEDTPNLAELRISNCSQVTDEGLRAISRLRRLRSLDLTNCVQITDDGVEALLACTELQQLRLTYCELITDRSLRAVAQLRDLRLLDISGCRRLTFSGLSYLSSGAGLCILRGTPRMTIGDGLGKL